MYGIIFPLQSRITGHFRVLSDVELSKWTPEPMPVVVTFTFCDGICEDKRVSMLEGVPCTRQKCRQEIAWGLLQLCR